MTLADLKAKYNLGDKGLSRLYQELYGAKNKTEAKKNATSLTQSDINQKIDQFHEYHRNLEIKLKPSGSLITFSTR